MSDVVKSARTRRVVGAPGLAIVAVAVCLAAWSGGAADAEEPRLDRIRFVGSAAYGRVVIDLSAPAGWSLLELPPAEGRPARLVLDVSGATVAEGARQPLRLDGSLLAGIRTGQFDEATARVVLDLDARVRHRIFALSDPQRIVIDLRTENEAKARGGRVLRADSSRERVAAVEPGPVAPPAPSSNGSHPARRARIMIDPGHGGKDPGAQSGGVREKDVVLAVAKLLRERLAAHPSLDVRMTRDEDHFLELEERMAEANAAGADLFISIHANASPRRLARGLEVYTLSNSNDRATLRLARIENERMHHEGPQIVRPGHDETTRLLLMDLLQAYKLDDSRRLAKAVSTSVESEARRQGADLQNLGVKEGPFYVLVGARMPSILVELGFLTNPGEREHLRSRRYQQTLADGIYEGVQAFLRDGTRANL